MAGKKKDKDAENTDDGGKKKVDASLDPPAEGGEGAAEGEGGGLNAKKILLFVVLPLFLLAGAGGGLYFSGMLDKFLKKDEAAAEEGAEHTEGEHAKEGDHKEAAKGKDDKSKKKKDSHGKDGHGAESAGIAGAYFLQIPNMLVNLASSDGQPRYLRLSVQLELESEEDLHAVEAVMPRVVDQFQTYLRELRVKDLRGSAGMYRLQMELLARVNAAAYPVEVKDVLFQEILIQ